MTAPETYTPSNPRDVMSIADSGLNARGNRSSFPDASPARNAARLSAGGTGECSIS
jgi:hypothetical protein